VLVHNLRLRTPDGHPLQGGYPIVSCKACGTGFADTVVPVEYYERYYGELAKYSGEAAVEMAVDSTHLGLPPEPDWQSRKALDAALRIERACPSRAARILDIGCATGSTLGALQSLGYSALFGIDPSADAVRLANSRPGVRAHVGSFASLPADLGRFDCIAISAVLEHLWNIDAAIATLHDLLSPDGVVYIDVPDAATYLDPYISPFEDFHTEHVNHLSFTSLRWIANRNGFATVSEESYQAGLTDNVVVGAAAVTWKATTCRSAPEHRDDNLADVLTKFTARSIADYARIEALLERELAGSRRFVLWGIGEAAFKLLTLEPLATRESVAFIDGNPARWGFSFDGSRVVGPDFVPPGEDPIVVATLNRADSIVSDATKRGVGHRLVRVDSW